MTVADINTIRTMARWEPDARGRLAEAAFALYAGRGFEQTTVAEIAERAGLTERTFFRHFADKREVLFAGAEVLEGVLVDAVADAPDSLAPIDLATVGLEAIVAQLPDRELARRRSAIIAANPELQERELIKLASLSTALAAALRDRGVTEPSASLTAEIAMSVFRIAFERWIADANERDRIELIHESLAEVRALAAA